MSAPLSPAEQTSAAKEFADFWAGKGYEKGQTQPFWLHLLRVLGVEAPEAFIEFEDAARMDEVHGFIDAYIPSTHVLVEQKKLSRDLRANDRAVMTAYGFDVKMTESDCVAELFKQYGALAKAPVRDAAGGGNRG